jgi:four helix bundle protein
MVLNVENLSMELCDSIYRLTAKLPISEQFGLCSQIRRAVVSITSNLAEGNSYSDGNKKVLFKRAYGSCREVQIQLRLIQRLYSIHIAEEYELSDKIGGMIYNLISALMHSCTPDNKEHRVENNG